MTQSFYHDTLEALVAESWLRTDDEVLVIAGGELDHEVVLATGLRKSVISNLDDRMRGDEFAPLEWSFQDAEDLSYPDGAFDVCIVHQGLHHCRSPHRALLEMYRVARRGLIVFEPQETLLTRAGVRLGVGQQYECAAVAANELRWGGVQNSEIPNFVYRWTEREVRKTLAAFDPTGPPRVRCYYDLRVPGEKTAAVRSPRARALARVAVPLARATLAVLPRQANAIAVVADKLGHRESELHPWLVADETGPHPDATWFGMEPASTPAGGNGPA